MGLFSGISKAFKSATKVIGNSFPFGIGDAITHNEDKDFSANQSALAYQRQVEMYQNRHQWEVNDLKAAGLNPILSATNGTTAIPSVQQAVTPSGSSGSGNSTEAVLGLVNSALKKKELDIDDKRANADLINANANAARQKNDALKTKADIEMLEFTKENTKANTDLLAGQLLKLFADIDNSARITDATVNQLNAYAYQAVLVGNAQAEYHHAAAEYQRTQDAAAKAKMESWATKVEEQEAKLKFLARSTFGGKLSYTLGLQVNDLLGISRVGAKFGSGMIGK